MKERITWESVRQVHSYRERIRKIIDLYPTLSRRLICMRIKDAFINYLYDLYIRMYVDADEKKGSFLCLLDCVNENEDWIDFFYEVVFWDGLSKRQTEIFKSVLYNKVS